jgi:hypothetical protein
MKTEYGHYYVFLDVDEFWDTVKFWRAKGYTLIQESHVDYSPKVIQNDMPVVLNVDDNSTMMYGLVWFNRERYFSDPTFVKLYNKKLRELKLKRIIK